MSWYYVLNPDHTVRPTDDVMEWGKQHADMSNRRVGFDKLDGEVEVSTVFLGTDHAFGGGPPLLFETMVFGGPHSDWQDRYHTWDEAESAHKRIVANLLAGADPDGVVEGEVVEQAAIAAAPASTPDGGQ